jgi:biopolymer transport protein TolR
MAISTGGGGGSVADINVTPLVDVLLVLLIIFMITAPESAKAPDMKLPTAKQAGPLPIDEDKLTVTIRKETALGKETAAVYFGPTKLDPARMREQIQGNAKIRTDKSVYVQADESLPYGEVQRIMGLLRQAGAERIGLVVDPSE